ncbi:MAG: hypothetical protein AMXMBFR33_56160 [Candidatus Xenobia bacterium]
MTAADFDRCISLKEAAELACCHHQTLRQAIRHREIEVVRRGGVRGHIFIRLSALDSWIKRTTIPASRVAVA